MRGDGTPHVLPPVTQKLMSKKKKGEPQNYMFGEMRYVKKKTRASNPSISTTP